ncbi:EAP30/Vps36 family-domain-containing protein [Epithele typhae]|uniref:EAP30/Vps36 family-domain-containing protein n=1 Tax=Epithele typhae TaxID=378194 RepID=UPI0020085630|nr:EAP30/Vps36 family-domain-containing protein [Epithele typhae]KAH9917156.1 EAP30/Vps36 family-domain-containing protein [Epithele typhae]
MSDSDEIQQLVTATGLFRIANYSEVAALTLIAYDHFLTFSGELQFVWGRRFSGATVVFALNRYVNLAGKVVLPISTMYWPNQTDETCAAPIILVIVLTVVAYWIAAVFSALRIYAVWDKNWRLLVLVLLLAMAVPVTNMYHYIRSTPVAGGPPLNGCGENVDLSDEQFEQLSMITHGFAIATDLLVVVLTWLKTYEIRRLSYRLHFKTSLSTLLLRDGTLYFGILLILNVIDIILNSNESLYNPLPPFIEAVTCILISRFMLNLRQTAQEMDEGTTTVALSQFSSIQIASGLAGDMGAPLSHGTAWTGGTALIEAHTTYDISNSYDRARALEIGAGPLAAGDAAFILDRECRFNLYNHHPSLSLIPFLSTAMHRLGGAGLAAFDRQRESQRSFAELSSELSQAQVDLLHAQLAQFRAALAHYAATHRDRIRAEPSFRHAFQQMCAGVGVDPLAGPRTGGWWAELLGLGDWQHELGVQIVDVCVSTRERNGGLIDVGELVRIVSRLRGGKDVVTEEDVVRSIRTLRPLGAGYEVIEVGGGRRMVRSVPRELDADQAVVLAVAQEAGGRVSEAGLVARKGWTTERARAALENMLLRDGLCWLDEQDEEYGVSYWVPSAMRWDE